MYISELTNKERKIFLKSEIENKFVIKFFLRKNFLSLSVGSLIKREIVQLSCLV